MSRYKFDDDEPYVVIEQQAAGITPFLIGVAIGAGVALLLAPRSGAATRRGIKRSATRVRRAAEQAASDVTTNVADTFHDARRRVEEQIDSARQAIDLKRQQATRAMNAGRAAARDARHELEHRIAETKAEYHARATVGRTSRAAVGDDDLGDE